MNKKNGFGPEDWDGDGKIDDYDEMMELRMFEKTSKIVCPPGFDIFEDSSKSYSYLDDDDDDDFDDDNENIDDDGEYFDDDYDKFDDDEFDEGFGDGDWDSDDF